MIKRFNLSIEIDDDMCNITTENNGFTAVELIGFLEMKQQDILDQLREETKVRYKRTAHVDGKAIEIEDVKND